jgi:predicted N-formylglutamate amidohydrolase
MDRIARVNLEPGEPAFSAVETIAGPLDAGVLLVCDHASNAIPPGYGGLGLRRDALERHIAYDIGAADLTRALARRLDAPAVLSTFSRLLIDPNRGADDPTLVMRYSDGAIVPGNARIDAAEIARRLALFWAPYRQKIDATVDAMLATGEPSALVSIHSFTPVWRGAARRWKVGVLWDRDDRIAKPLLEALHAEPDLEVHGVGDNEPYDGALAGDTIDAVATARGLANALIEIRQDLVDEPAGAIAWAERFARLLEPILADKAVRAPRPFGSRAKRGRTANGSQSRRLWSRVEGSAGAACPAAETSTGGGRRP